MLRSVFIWICISLPIILNAQQGNPFTSEPIKYDGSNPIRITSEKMRYTNDGPFPFHVLGQNENLPVDMVYSLHQDSKGNIWIAGGGGGLVAFDGIYFYDYSDLVPFRDKNIMDIIEDRNGDLWFATLGHGMVRFDGKHFYEHSDRTGLPGERLKIIDLFEDASGRIWAATQKQGVLVYEEGSFSQIWDGIYGDTFGAIGQAPDGSLWFGSWTGNISIYQDGVWNCITTQDGLPSSPIKAIFPFDGKMWIGSMDGMFLSDGISVTPYSAACAQGVFKAKQASNGDIWVSTRSQRILHITSESQTCYAQDAGLPEGPTAGIMQDDQGSIWMGSVGNGIAKLESLDFEHFTYTKEDLPQDVKCISEGASSHIALGYLNKEVHLFDPEQNAFQFLFEAPYELHCMKWLGDDLYIGTDHGAYLWKNGALETILPPDRFVQIVYDIGKLPEYPNHVALGTSQGMYLISENDTMIWNKDNGLKSNQINKFQVDKVGWLWCATSDGLAIKPPEESLFNVLSTDEGMDHGTVLSDINIIDEQIWISNYGSGLYIIDREEAINWVASKEAISIRFLGSKHGLPNENTLSFLPLSKEEALIQTRRGIVRFDLRKEEGIELYEAKDGLKPKNLIQGGELEGDSIAWWIGEHYAIKQRLRETHYRIAPPNITLAGIDLYFDPLNTDSLLDLNQEFKYSRAIGTNYQFLSGLRKYDHMPSGLILSSDQNHLSFRFRGSDWYDPRGVQFQYYLQGEDENWLEPDAARKATYQNLAPGSYLLHYRTVGSDGSKGKEETFAFSIHIPFWQTTWFIALTSFIAILLLYLLFRWRMYRLRKENQVLDAKVKERTKEVQEEKEKSDQLLLNILPKETADELKESGNAQTQQYDECSVIFSDFSGFTKLTETMNSAKLVSILDRYFQAWDDDLSSYHIEKIKTIGDAYMCASGLPIREKHHAVYAVAFALSMQERAKEINREREAKGETPWNLRIGIHSGPVIAGVVGRKKFAYDIWGDTVNTAARMESSGIAGEINISAKTFDLIKDFYDCEHRGKVEAKSKGEMDMYLVKGLKPEFSAIAHPFELFTTKEL